MNKCMIVLTIFFGSMAFPVATSATETALKDNLTAECVFNPEDPENCARVVGCIGEEGAYYTGRAIGWNEGSFSGVTSEGVSCSGAFTYRSFLDMGKSTMKCDNGENTELTFFARTEGSKVSVGQGRSNKGRRVLLWAGSDVVNYLKSVKENGTQGLICAGQNIPLE